ncbi:MAG: hypothetical protein HY295_00855 [Thaumarchaeota archaeon]|nr:hypothetical protein [Nitrososphaerota archaeon]
MSTKETKPKKPRSSTKKATTAQLEAKIAELEAKLTSLSAQVRPAETRPPPPKPAETRPPPPKPAETRPPPPKAEEVAAAYSSVSSESYTGNRYFATRQRLAYHPPDKQFRGGQVTVTVQVSPPPKVEAPEPEPEPQPAPKEEPRRIEPPVPRVKYTGTNYYSTRRRLAYHPPDKQFIETKPVTFEETPSAAEVESPQLASQLKPSQTSSQSKPRSSWKAKGHM